MRSLTLLLASTVLLGACGPGETLNRPDAGPGEPDAAPFLDARPRFDAPPAADAAPGVDAALGVDAAPGVADARPAVDAAPSTPDAASTPDAGPVVGNTLADSDFSVTDFDTMNLVDKCTSLAPWGAGSWGVNAETYDAPGVTVVAGARFRVTNQQAYLYLKEDDNHHATAKFVQGDIYGGNACGTTPWSGFGPIAMAGKNVDVGINIFRDTATLNVPTDAWLSMSITAWFSSPNMPKAGNDVNGKAPLVVELYLHRQCGPSCPTVGNDEYPTVYQYRKTLGDAPSQAWFEVGTSLSQTLADAITAFNLQAAASTMKLYQLEFEITARNATGAASIDDFVLNVSQ